MGIRMEKKETEDTDDWMDLGEGENLWEMGWGDLEEHTAIFEPMGEVGGGSERETEPSPMGGGVEDATMATVNSLVALLVANQGPGKSIELLQDLVARSMVVMKQEGLEEAPPAVNMPTEAEGCTEVGCKRPLSCVSAGGYEQKVDSGEEVTFEQELVEVEEQISVRLDTPASQLIHSRTGRLVQAMRVARETPGVTLEHTSTAQCLLGFDSIRVEKQALPQLLERLEKMVKEDVRCLWWKLTKAGAPKHLTTPVYEVWRDVGITPDRPLKDSVKKPEHVDSHMYAEKYSYTNDEWLKRMVSKSLSSPKQKKARKV